MFYLRWRQLTLEIIVVSTIYNSYLISIKAHKWLLLL
jgi:hypothetical protein